MSCQRIKLVGKRHAVAALYYELAFANHVHEFEPCEDCLRRAKRLEAKHRPGDPFDGTMILLHDVVEVFDLPDLDRDVPFRIQLVDAALLVPLLSIVTFSGASLLGNAWAKKRMAAALSRLAVSRKSTGLPCLSTAR